MKKNRLKFPAPIILILVFALSGCTLIRAGQKDKVVACTCDDAVVHADNDDAWELFYADGTLVPDVEDHHGHVHNFE